jgi:chloramphenicol O-acetyltransferase
MYQLLNIESWNRKDHSLRAANAIPSFKYRIAGQDVIVYDQVNASPTINRKDGTFFGRIQEENGKMPMPVSISVHYALMDGFHVGQYLDLFSTMLNES